MEKIPTTMDPYSKMTLPTPTQEITLCPLITERVEKWTHLVPRMKAHYGWKQWAHIQIGI